MPKPTIYLIAGCNGAGKTTFAKEFLPYEVKCLRFYNADEIARGLSPLDPAAGAFKAGRLLLTEVRSSIARRETFALETTLSGKTYVRIFESALAGGYDLELHYLWLASPDQAIARVRRRVRMGGHGVPVGDIRRRFIRSRIHLIKDYLPRATRWVLWDSRGIKAKRLATSHEGDINFARQLIDRWSTRKTKGATKTPAFVARAERAFARVALKVRLESRRSGLPAVVFPTGKATAKKTQIISR
jgi:predicted ABC-type ATPase